MIKKLKFFIPFLISIFLGLLVLEILGFKFYISKHHKTLGPFSCGTEQLRIEYDYGFNYISNMWGEENFEFYILDQLVATTRNDFYFEEKDLEISKELLFGNEGEIEYSAHIFAKDSIIGAQLAECLVDNRFKIYENLPEERKDVRFGTLIVFKKDASLRRYDSPLN